MTRDGRPAAASRRGVLSALAGLAALPGVTASGTLVPEDVVDLAAATGGDGWRPVGDVELSRVDRGAWSTAARGGERALRAAADGAVEPAVARPVDAAELLATPYLTADVVPGAVPGLDGPVAFEFRLAGGRGTDDRTVLARSDPVVVRQAVPGRIYWAATGVDAVAARRATALEIAWYPAPADRDRDAGGEPPAVPYHGAVVLDAVGASAAPDAVAAARFVRTIRRLEADHGSLDRTDVTERGATAAAGRFVFADGTTAPYRFEARDGEGYRLSVAGEAVEFAGEAVEFAGEEVESAGETDEFAGEAVEYAGGDTGFGDGAVENARDAADPGGER